MPFVVTENCIKCKYTDCVEVCPVDCFHEGPNFLVIDPDECIDCTLCEPECPINAIYPEDDVPAGQEGIRRPQRRTVQGLAGDHRAQGRAARRQGLGRQDRASSTSWSAEPKGRTRPAIAAAKEKRAPLAPVFVYARNRTYWPVKAVRSESISLRGASPLAGMPRGSTADT